MLLRSYTPQVNCGCSDVAAESRFARLREHFQIENALSIANEAISDRHPLPADGSSTSPEQALLQNRVEGVAQGVRFCSGSGMATIVPKTPLRVTFLPLLTSALHARRPRAVRQRARPLRGRRSVGPPLHAAWPCGGGSSLHGSLTLAPPAVNCFLRFQHIGQGEDGLADEVEQLRRAGEQQTEIEAQQKGGQSALDGHGQHIDVEL